VEPGRNLHDADILAIEGAECDAPTDGDSPHKTPGNTTSQKRHGFTCVTNATMVWCFEASQVFSDAYREATMEVAHTRVPMRADRVARRLMGRCVAALCLLAVEAWFVVTVWFLLRW
jgi:hypothetical protein